MKNRSAFKVVKLVWPDVLQGLGPVRSDYRNQGFYTLVDTKSGFQPPLVNLFAYEQRLIYPANTVRNYLFDISILYVATAEQGIDLDSRFAQLDPLKKIEVQSICNATSWNRVSEVLQKAATTTIARRLSTIRTYLTWGFERYLEKLTNYEKKRIIVKEIERMLNWIGSDAPKDSEIKDSIRSPVALSNEQLALLRFAISPGMSHNPFRPSTQFAEQYRNAAIVMLLLEAGIRPSELCILELSDVFQEKKSLWVSKWSPDSLSAQHNESEAHRLRRKFPRRSVVGHKTVGREIALSNVMLRMLDDYCDHRHKILKKFHLKRSPYLFLSTLDGGPMTPSGIRSLTLRIAKVFPEIGKLTSYTFRHTSVTISSEVMRSAVAHLPSLAADQKFREALTYKFGWCLRSDMVEHYGRADIRRALAELATEHSRRISTFSWENIKAANDAN